ncbi:MAG: hypothetical protein KGY67_01710 [Candidatus Thermoplasmatota archaeon]|nr:hypothetical protein [Candidatus Thermoplasmatota archaeon]
MGEKTMRDLEKPYHLKNKLGHPSIEDVAIQHNELLQNMLSFPTKNTLNVSETMTSPLQTPNDRYKNYLLQQIKTYNETSDKE